MRRNSKRITTTAAALLALATVSLAPATAGAATKKACLRGNATLEAKDRDVRVVRTKAKRTSSNQTRRELVYACWAKTGKRIRISEEVDFGDDNRASTRVEIVQGRYVGVIETNEGGVSISRVARIYDARTSKLLHTSAECEKVDQIDFNGVSDVVFLEGGGMAMVCRQLLLYRNANAALETLEPLGTDVAQVAVSNNSDFFAPRLFWLVRTGDTETSRSIRL